MYNNGLFFAQLNNFVTPLQRPQYLLLGGRSLVYGPPPLPMEIRVNPENYLFVNNNFAFPIVSSNFFDLLAFPPIRINILLALQKKWNEFLGPTYTKNKAIKKNYKMKN